MAADPIIYCLEKITDYDQFERLSHDLMMLDGYGKIEPMGGSKDKGRDAIHVDASTGVSTIFAYSVREDWQKKLKEDSAKIKKHGHACQRLIFLCTATFTSAERDAVMEIQRRCYGWTLELYGSKELRGCCEPLTPGLSRSIPPSFVPLSFQRQGAFRLHSHLII